ncbi:zinc finger protein [Aphelenchoides avenae]|nr:zinc finger protein [Aphelenchus avenae]
MGSNTQVSKRLNWDAAQSTRLIDCPVCGAPAYAKHFSVITCNACSAFYRRTLSHNKQYFCKKGKRCMVQGQVQKNNICKYCRFQTCVKVGMRLPKASNVPCTSVDQVSDNDSPVRRMILCRKAAFVNRARALARVYGGQKNIPQMANMLVNACSASMSSRAEYEVVQQYLKTSGMLDVDLPDVCLNRLVSTVLYTWAIYEGALFTVRNGGQHTKKLYFLDESYLPYDEGSMVDFYSGDPTVLNIAAAARHGMEFNGEVLQLARKFHKTRLDEAEQAVFTQLFILHTAIEITKSPKSFAPALSKLFGLLQEHYVRNYDDVAVKMDQMIYLLQELMHVKRLLNEHLIVLKLSGKRLFINESGIQEHLEGRETTGLTNSL